MIVLTLRSASTVLLPCAVWSKCTKIHVLIKNSADYSVYFESDVAVQTDIVVETQRARSLIDN